MAILNLKDLPERQTIADTDDAVVIVDGRLRKVNVLALKRWLQSINAQVLDVTAGTEDQNYDPGEGYYYGRVAVHPTPSQSKQIAPTTAQQIVAPDAGWLLSSVEVLPINTTKYLPLPRIVNADSITPTGTYTPTSYYSYDTTFGVKCMVGYDGTVYLLMQSDKSNGSTSYENIYYTAGTLPDGAALATLGAGYVSASNVLGNLFGCAITGLQALKSYRIAIACTGRDATYDYYTMKVTITEEN